MDFQNQTLWTIILKTIFYMDFEMVQTCMMCWLGSWFWLNNILRQLSLKILHDGICKILPMNF